MEIGKATRSRQPKNGDRAPHVWLRLVLLVVIIAGLTWAIYASGLIQHFWSQEGLLQFLKSVHPWDEVVFILLQAAQVIVAPIPGEITGLVGGYLYGPLLGVLWSTIGLTLGSYVAFILARWLGRPAVEKFVPQSFMGRFDYLLHHKGAFVVFLLFLVPGVPKDTLCWFLGLGHLTTLEFLMIGGTGRLFGTVLLTVGGDLIRHQHFVILSMLAAFTLIFILVAMAYREKMERGFRFWHIKGIRRRRLRQSNSRT